MKTMYRIKSNINHSRHLSEKLAFYAVSQRALWLFVTAAKSCIYWLIQSIPKTDIYMRSKQEILTNLRKIHVKVKKRNV